MPFPFAWRVIQISDLPSGELVPGDVVELHAGDKVPADIRVMALRTATVRAEQSSLTGKLQPCYTLIPLLFRQPCLL